MGFSGFSSSGTVSSSSLSISQNSTDATQLGRSFFGSYWFSLVGLSLCFVRLLFGPCLYFVTFRPFVLLDSFPENLLFLFVEIYKIEINKSYVVCDYVQY